MDNIAETGLDAGRQAGVLIHYDAGSFNCGAGILPAIFRDGVLFQYFASFNSRAGYAVVAGLVLALLGVWLVWKWRETIGRRLGIFQDITDQIPITDPHGLHMRRCKDLVLVARKHVAYRIFVRSLSARNTAWTNARSILSLQALGVRGSLPDGKPPILEVRVYGYRPWRVMGEIRQVLEKEREKYLSVYEIFELAKKGGGQMVAKTTPPAPLSWPQKLGRIKSAARDKINRLLRRR